MSQGPGDDVLVYVGLQGFAVEGCEIETRDDGQRIKVVKLVSLRRGHLCSECGRWLARGLFEEAEAIRFRDNSLGDFETYLEIRPIRVACCGGTRVERLPFAAPGFRMTRRFFERIAALCTRMAVSVVAEMAGLSWETVARVDKRAIELGLGDPTGRLNGLRWIGVDEVSRTGGHVYFTVVTDLERGRVVWVGDGKGEQGLLPFFEALGKKRKRRIRGAVSDLGYQSLLAEHLPQATWVLDRFHIVKWLNEALNELRRDLFGAAPDNGPGRQLKVKKWLLLSARERLEHKHKLLLARLMTLNEPLYKAYLLKEELRSLLRHPWVYLGALRKRLADWLDAMLTSDVVPMQRVARRIAPHVEAIVAGYGHRIKLGLVEAINGKIAALRLSAHGYRDPEYYKLKIFQHYRLPDNP
jgi:transposase